MKWSLPLTLGTVFLGSLAYLHLAPKAEETSSSLPTAKAESSCCTPGAGCCAEGAACCEHANAVAAESPCGLPGTAGGSIDDLFIRAGAAMVGDGTPDVWINGPGEEGPEQVLRVNFLDMNEGVDPATSYQLLPCSGAMDDRAGAEE